jgi:hypothetical protein
MDMTCHVCGYNANYLKFAYLCKNGCPACGESDMRLCPACGTKCVFSRSESLEGEELKMRELSVRLAGMVMSQDPQVLAEAKNLLEQLHEINLRWNIPALHQFLKERQHDLFPE